MQVREEFPAHAEAAEKIVANRQILYRHQGIWNLAFFRVVGAIEVVLGVSFPLIILYSPDDPVLLSTISVAIAIAAALSSFFGWSQNWQLHRSQELVMDALVARWNLQMLNLLDDSEKRIDKKDRAIEISSCSVTHQAEHAADREANPYGRCCARSWAPGGATSVSYSHVVLLVNDLAPHAAAIAAALGLPQRNPDEPYVVEPLFVTRQPTAAQFVSSPFPFTSAGRMLDHLAGRRADFRGQAGLGCPSEPSGD